MAQNNGLNTRSSKLRITGLKEPIVWINDEKDNKPVGWMAGVGIEGLIPDLFRGYKFNYTRELISPDGHIVNTGILSQAPGYLGTSTTVTVGGRGLSSGTYTVRVWADNGEMDNTTLIVPDYETYLTEIKQQEELKKSQTLTSDLQTDMRVKNSSLQFVNEVYLKEGNRVILLTVERKDGSTYSAVLKDPTEVPYVNQVIIDDKTIEMVRKSVSIWGDKVNQFAEQYLKDDRKEIELFNDIVTLAKCLAQLPNECSSILKFSGATDLLHSRIMAQIMCEYYSLGFQIKPTSNKHSGQKIHDFDASGYNTVYKCEVKTIQSIGELEHRPLGGYRLTNASYKSIVSAIRDDLEDAKKIGDTDITIIAPWSYRINALLRVYFEKELLLFPPPPSLDVTILVLTSNHVFEDYYVSLPSDRALSILETAFSHIQVYGITPLIQVPIREGLTIQASTAPRKGSSAGYSFSPPKESE
jgi:hypothetical protein